MKCFCAPALAQLPSENTQMEPTKFYLLPVQLQGSDC